MIGKTPGRGRPPAFQGIFPHRLTWPMFGFFSILSCDELRKRQL
jgi:hypothetical protein